MPTFLVMPTVGSCVETSTLPSAGGPIAITKPVGQGGLARNLPDDVRKIQEALNQVTAQGQLGGPMPFLKVDGIKGPKTQAAIINFQRIQVPNFNADGLIEPEGPTLLRLNEVVAPVSKLELNAKLAVALPLVRTGLSAAVANLTAIITSGPTASGRRPSPRTGSTGISRSARSTLPPKAMRASPCSRPISRCRWC